MRNKQAGGIVSFIIVAVALAGLLAGGLYLSKQQGRAARENDTSTPQVSTTDTKEKTDEKKNESGAERDEAQQAPQGNSETRQEQSRPATNDTPSGGATTPNNGNTRTDRVATTGPSTVPSTGPTETAIVSLALGVIVFTAYRFVQSRRTLRASALRQ